MNQDNFSVRFENRFIMVNYDVIMSGLLTAYEIAVYVTLCAYANNTDRSCFPSYSTLARRAGCCRSTAIRAIARLEELSFIEKQNQSSKAGDSTSNLYTIKTAVTVQKEKASSEPVLRRTVPRPAAYPVRCPAGIFTAPPYFMQNSETAKLLCWTGHDVRRKMRSTLCLLTSNQSAESVL